MPLELLLIGSRLLVDRGYPGLREGRSCPQADVEGEAPISVSHSLNRWRCNVSRSLRLGRTTIAHARIPLYKIAIRDSG